MKFDLLSSSQQVDRVFRGRQALVMGTPLPSIFALNYFKNYTAKNRQKQIGGLPIRTNTFPDRQSAV
jgi:hypothetical protein